jgi:hypothetical protein
MGSGEITLCFYCKLLKEVKLTPIDVQRPLEEAWNIVLEYGEGLVELLQHSHHRVVLLYVLLRLSHRHLSVETPGGNKINV